MSQRFAAIIGASLLICLILVTCRSRDDGEPGDQPQGSVELSAWDPIALAAFEARGVAPPRTRTTGTSTRARFDPAAIRESFADARPLEREVHDEEEVELEESEEAMGEDGVVDDAVVQDFEVESAQGAANPSASPGGGAGPAGAPATRNLTPGNASPASPPPASEFLFEDRSGRESGDRDQGKTDGDEGLEAPTLALRSSAPRLGKILFNGPDGKTASLEPEALRLTVYIDGPRARTVVDYVFVNPFDRDLEGTFHYTLPADATPAGFGMFRENPDIGKLGELHGADALLPPLEPSRSTGFELAASAPATGGGRDWKELQEARVVGRIRAREVYESIVRENIDPALLEWSGGNTFRGRVFPIGAASYKRVVLVYEQTLPREGNRLVYAYPLPSEPGLGRIPIEIRVHGDAETRCAPAAAVVSGPAKTADGWQQTRLDLAPEGGQVTAAIVAETGADIIRGSAAPLDGEAFYARLTPDLPAREVSEDTGRAVFMLDTSLSGEGERQGLSAELLLQVLERDETIRDYAVMLFDVRPRWLHDRAWRPNHAAGRAETRRELERIYVEGATDLDAAISDLEAAEADLGTLAEARIFLLSDGEITWGQDRARALLDRHPAAMKAPWMCYRFGDLAANLDLFAEITSRSGGQLISVLNLDAVPEAALAHRRASVRMTGLRVEGSRVRDLVVAGDPVLLHPGQALEVAGRQLDGRAGRIVVELEVDGETVEQSWPLAAGGGGLAARAWAEMHARRLLAREEERLDRTVVALSQAFGLANRVASFLVLESEEDWERFELKDEDIPLEDLAATEGRELDRLVGFRMDTLTADASEILSRLKDHGPFETQPSPILDFPLSGGDDRIDEELRYREARAKDDLDVANYTSVARARGRNGDVVGSIRALSCLVEKKPRNAEAARFVGYACLALDMPREAASLFEKVRIERPFEPQCYLDEALALERLGDLAGAARDYEIVLAKRFRRHALACATLAKMRYRKLLLLAAVQGALPESLVRGRVERFMEPAGEGYEQFPLSSEKSSLECTLHWNSDAVDIDLWVFEPEETRVYYGQQSSEYGGYLMEDLTDGYGPEVYQRRTPSRGRFEIAVNYFGNNSARWSVPTAVLLVTEGDERRFRFRLLEGKKETALSLGFEDR